jgi:hypothetical protein
MRKSRKFAAVLAGIVALTSVACVSAFADSRHRDETWRDDHRDRGRYERDSRRRDDRDLVSGVVERVDRRLGVVVLRDPRGGRPIPVKMIARRGERAGVDLSDLRRGDRVTFVGDWGRGGVFEAWRIDSVDSRRGGRNRW